MVLYIHRSTMLPKHLQLYGVKKKWKRKELIRLVQEWNITMLSGEVLKSFLERDPKVFDKNSTSGQDKKDITGPDTELIYV